jgi:arginase family enzyme
MSGFSSKFSRLYGFEVPALRPEVPTLFGVPLARTRAELAGADAAVIGVPYDRVATAGRAADSWAGYRRAPEATRQSSLRFRGYLPELDLDVFDCLRLVDYGDAEIGEDMGANIEAVAAKVRDCVEQGVRPITVGGFSPCASYAAVKGIAAATRGRVGCVSLDAHGDCLDREYGPQGDPAPGSATWQARMWDDFPSVDPRLHVEIGMRGPRNAREQAHRYREFGATLVPAMTALDRGIADVCARDVPRAFAGAERVWMHLDMDVHDIGAIGDWGDEPCGLSTREVCRLTHQVGLLGGFGLSFVYVAPQSQAAAVACYNLVYFLAGLVLGGHLRRGRA